MVVIIDKDTRVTVTNLTRDNAETFQFAFTDDAGDPAAPDTLTIEVEHDGETTATYELGTDTEIVTVDDGVYAFTQTFDKPWTWWIRCTGTGTAAASRFVEVHVAPDPFDAVSP